MTVTYTHEVADCRGFGNFWRLLFRWRGSVYKLVWLDLVLYTLLYYMCSAVYRLMLDEEGKRTFEKVSLYCHYFSDLIPVSFVLGFYVSIVIKRWWEQYMSLPWPDSLALFISTSIHGHDRQGRLMRRTIARYVNLSFVLTLIMVTPRAKKRFPTLEHLVETGLMTANEKKIFENLMEKTPHSLYYLPLVWAGTLVTRARKEGRIRDDFAVKTIVDELNSLRGKLGGLLSYDWISIPLVYTQVVSLAVYTFFLSTIMGRQFLDPSQKYSKNNVDMYFPVFTMLQFFFYMGWLKVAESLVNPFGEDDDDFEVNWLIDRNIQVSYLIVDEMHNEHPELTQDLYWDEVFPQELPYTVASEQFRRDPPMGSTANIQIPEAEQEFLPILDEEPETEEVHDKGSHGLFIKRLDSVRSIGSSAPSARKSSFLSILHNRLLRGGERRSSIGSQSSIQRSRTRELSRCPSHISGTSHNSAYNRNNTSISFQDSDIFNMSEESLTNTGRREECVNHRLQPRHTGASAHDDDDAILIKIKRRDRDDQEMRTSLDDLMRDPSQDMEVEPHLEAGYTCHAPARKLVSQVSRMNEWDDSNNKLNEMKCVGSHCSIRTSIFQDPESALLEDSGGDQIDHSICDFLDKQECDQRPEGASTSLMADMSDADDTLVLPEEKSIHRVSWGMDKTHL
ncbi:bestrophin-4-like isoform X1 [Panulirus ornatus]|uniref:bestrophin-4-like isoform X1 n=2 Tax=Panulirus ornatus TaxID=150431 RepID=UPI003A86D741